jgi:hypothetical protein
MEGVVLTHTNRRLGEVFMSAHKAQRRTQSCYVVCDEGFVRRALCRHVEFTGLFVRVGGASPVADRDSGTRRKRRGGRGEARVNARGRAATVVLVSPEQGGHVVLGGPQPRSLPETGSTTLVYIAGRWCTYGSSREGFGIAFGGDFREHFRRGSSATSSPSEIDKSNKSNVCAEAQPVPPPPAEDTEDVCPSLILAFADEVFSKILRSKDCDLNFLLGFRGLASNFSCSEVLSPEQDDPFACFRFSIDFFGAGARIIVAATFRFLETHATSPKPGWQSRPASSNT